MRVAVEIDGNDVDGAGALVDRVIREGRLRRARRSVLDDRDVAGRAPAERRDGQIVLAVAVEVGRLDVGHARPLVEPERGAEFALAEPAQPDHRPLLVIGGKEGAHVADEQVLDAVAIHVDERGVRRIRNAGDDRQRPPAGEGRPVKTTPWRMSVPSTSRRSSPSKSTRDTCDTAGVPGMSGIVRPCRTNRTGDSPGSGQASGAGRRSGARAT